MKDESNVKIKEIKDRIKYSIDDKLKLPIDFNKQIELNYKGNYFTAYIGNTPFLGDYMIHVFSKKNKKDKYLSFFNYEKNPTIDEYVTLVKETINLGPNSNKEFHTLMSLILMRDMGRALELYDI